MKRSNFLKKKMVEQPPPSSNILGLDMVPVSSNDPISSLDKNAIKNMMVEDDRACAAIIKGANKNKNYALIDGNGRPLLERQIAAIHKRTAKIVTGMVKKDQVQLIDQFNMLNSLLNAKTDEQRINEELAAHPEISEAENLQRLKVLQAQAETMFTEVSAQLEEIRNGKNAAVRWLVHNAFAYFAVLTGGLSLESILTYFPITAMESNPYPNIFVGFIVAAIGVMLGFGCHFLGRALAYKEVGWKLYVPMATVLLPLCIVLFIRLGEDNEMMILALFNIAINLLATFWSYLKHIDEEELKYADATDNAALEKADLDNKIEAAEKRITATATKAVNDKLRPIKSQVETLKISLGDLESFLLNEVLTPIKTNLEYDIETLRTEIVKARAKNGYDPISFDGLSMLVFDGLESSPTAPPVSDVPVPSDLTTPTPEQSNGHKKASNSGSSLLSFLLLVMALFNGCTTTPSSVPVSKALGIFDDITNGPADSLNMYSAEDKVYFGLSVIDFEPVRDRDPMSVSLDAISFLSMMIDDRKFQFIADAPPLPFADTTIMRVDAKRRKVQKRFVSNAINLMKSMPNAPPEGLDSSLVVPCLCEGFTRLIDSGADESIAVIFSDMIEHRQGFSMYVFKRKSIMDEYAKLSAKIDEMCPRFRDLSGLDQVIVVNTPRADLDGLAVGVRGFWKRYFTERGTQFTWVPRIDRMSDKLAIQ